MKRKQIVLISDIVEFSPNIIKWKEEKHYIVSAKD